MLCPVVVGGETVLFDIYVAGRWIGSRRTIAQCIDRLRREGWPSAVIGSHAEAESFSRARAREQATEMAHAS